MSLRAIVALCGAASFALAGCASSPAERASAPAGVSAMQSTAAAHSPDATSSTAPQLAAPQAVTVPASTSAPKPNPCANNQAAQLVRVRLDVQRMWLCTKHRLDRTTPITSGIPGEYTSTPTGTYTVQALTRNTTLTLISGQTYAVKFWIPFDSPLFGFHDSSWQTIPYGSQKYRTDGSHGCVHMPLAAIRYLYHWADVGAKVRITQ